MYPAALIFNADGTISETDEIHRTSYNLSFRDHDLGWQWSHAIYARMINTFAPREKIVSFIRKYRPEETFHLEDSKLVRSLIESKHRHYLNLIETGSANLRPGVSRLIQEARNAGIKLALTSLSPRKNFEVILQNHFGLGALANFDAISTPEDIAPCRNESECMQRIYERTLETLGEDARNCVAIEARETGADAARHVDLNVIATPGLYTSSCRFRSADIVLSDLGHPAAPFQVIRGQAGPYHFVSIDSINSWSGTLAGAA